MKFSACLFFLVGALISFIGSSSNAQCFKEVEYSVIDSKNAIELKFDADYDNVKINLEDVYLTGNKVFEKSIELQNVSTGTSYIVFDKLRPSKYLIQLVTEDCKWMIGGMEGIIIKDENKK